MNAYTTIGALRRPTPRRTLRAMALAAVAALALAACNPDEALEVQDPDVVRPGDLNDKSGLASLRNGVIGSFQVAYAGGGDQSNFGHEGIIQLGGLGLSRQGSTRSAFRHALRSDTPARPDPGHAAGL